MERVKDGNASLLFLDASHFVMVCDFLGHIYGKVRRFAKTFSGDWCNNVLGAMDYVFRKVLVVANDSCIIAVGVCSMLQKIAVEYEKREVHMVLDNARYQKCGGVHELDIHLEYIPLPY